MTDTNSGSGVAQGMRSSHWYFIAMMAGLCFFASLFEPETRKRLVPNSFRALSRDEAEGGFGFERQYVIEKTAYWPSERSRKCVFFISAVVGISCLIKGSQVQEREQRADSQGTLAK